MVYLDHAAATPLDPEVLQAMQPWLQDQFGNPSSVHQLGQSARAAVDAARMIVADFIHCQPTEVYFTASGTESCNWSLLGIVEHRLLQGEQVHLIVSAIEHSAVLETARFLERSYGVAVEYLPVDEQGIVNVTVLEAMLRPETALVSVMMINNEIGTLQPIAAIGKLCRDKGVLLHTDACQAAPYYDLDVQQLGVQMLTMNASKLYGPKGIGVLYVQEDIDISPWSFGGGQEFKKRAGTENVAAIVGLGKALQVRASLSNPGDHEQQLRNQLWDRIQQKLPQAQLNGSFEQRSPNNLNIFLPGTDAETLVRQLDLKGFAVSMGSACSSGTIEPSHVIRALGGAEDRAQSSLRISVGRGNTVEEIEDFVAVLLSLLS